MGEKMSDWFNAPEYCDGPTCEHYRRADQEPYGYCACAQEYMRETENGFFRPNLCVRAKRSDDEEVRSERLRAHLRATITQTDYMLSMGELADRLCKNSYVAAATQAELTPCVIPGHEGHEAVHVSCHTCRTFCETKTQYIQAVRKNTETFEALMRTYERRQKDTFRVTSTTFTEKG